jgi:hypothetical protein
VENENPENDFRRDPRAVSLQPEGARGRDIAEASRRLISSGAIAAYLYCSTRAGYRMDKRALVLIAIAGFILVSGCTDRATPVSIVPTETPRWITVATTTPSPIPTETPHSKYLYERNGKYYFQKIDFVCTEPAPTYIYGQNGLIGIWCER